MEEKKEKTLIEELGLGHLSEEQKNQMNDQLADILQNRVTVRILEILTDEEKAELDKLVAAGDDEKADVFLTEKVPGLELIVQEEFESLKREMIKRNEDLKDALSHKKSE
jgi:hypothetical protein